MGHNNQVLFIRIVALAILTTVSVSALLYAQSDVPELQQSPSALASLTTQEINSIFGPSGGHTTSMRSPDGISGLIPILVKSGPQNIVVPCSASPDGPGVVGATLPTREEILYERSRIYSLIAVGTVGHTTSYMLPDGGFLYSMMPLHISDVIKNNPESPVQHGMKITIGREGGALRVGPKTVQAQCGNFRLFHPGKRYIVFLNYIPKANVYVARAAYELVNGKVASMRAKDRWNGSGPPIAGMDESDLVKTAKEQANKAAKEEPKK